MRRGQRDVRHRDVPRSLGGVVTRLSPPCPPCRSRRRMRGVTKVPSSPSSWVSDGVGGPAGCRVSWEVLFQALCVWGDPACGVGDTGLCEGPRRSGEPCGSGWEVPGVGAPPEGGYWGPLCIYFGVSPPGSQSPNQQELLAQHSPALGMLGSLCILWSFVSFGVSCQFWGAVFSPQVHKARTSRSCWPSMAQPGPCSWRGRSPSGCAATGSSTTC